MAEGIVKPNQAASAPGRPARKMPMLIPTWLDAGPGRNWQSATMSAKAAFVEPFAALDEFGAVIAEMGDRPAEARQPEAQKDAKHLRRSAGGFIVGSRASGPPPR